MWKFWHNYLTWLLRNAFCPVGYFLSHLYNSSVQMTVTQDEEMWKRSSNDAKIIFWKNRNHQKENNQFIKDIKKQTISCLGYFYRVIP